jgi:hypothetical protein
MGLPRIELVFRFRQCDKKNHGWCEGPPVTVLCQSFRSAGRPSPSGQISFEREKNTALHCCPPVLTQNIGRLFSATRRMPPKGSSWRSIPSSRLHINDAQLANAPLMELMIHALGRCP